MNTDLLTSLHHRFEDQIHEQEGVEFWYARDLQVLLGYVQWRNFLQVIEKAQEACKNSKYPILDHFVDVSKSIPVPKGGTREIEDIKLTRYACYLIAQNGDPRKEEIAFAQSYFAVQTRKQELIEAHMRLSERLSARRKLTESETELSKNLYERGISNDGFARIRSRGDAALFGGYSTREMKDRLGVPEKRPLADFLPMVTITAKNLATEITNFNVAKEDLHGEEPITAEHVLNNQDVRELLVKRGIVPEDLPDPDVL